METTSTPTVITIETTVNAPVEKVWESWTNPEHVVNWNNASEDWHTPRAENDPRTGGRFSYHMASKDGKMGFDFAGVYDEVRENEYIEYTMGDGRNVKNTFTNEGGKTHIVVRFEAENTNSLELQKGGWQAILDNFKRYTEKTFAE
jgi:uncharacterized protein YndB with AHSA1/START domain